MVAKPGLADIQDQLAGLIRALAKKPIAKEARDALGKLNIPDHAECLMGAFTAFVDGCFDMKRK